MIDVSFMIYIAVVRYLLLKIRKGEKGTLFSMRFTIFLCDEPTSI